MKAFWKLMPKDLQRHLRVDGNIHSEDTFWKTRSQQKAMEAKFAAAGDPSAVCYQCRYAETLVKKARAH